jgi:hypothetical protein
MDKYGPHNKRFDSTSDTLLRMTGYTMSATETRDNGEALPANVAVGLIGDGSGGLTGC